MKVVSSNVSDSEISSEIDLEVPKELLPKVRQQVGDFLLEQVLLSVGSSKSPVSGESWPALSAQYRKEKMSEGLPGKANLEASGSMLDALTWQETDKGLVIGIFGDQAPKADGHNNFSGESELPQRRFLPDAGQTFVSRIQKEAEQIIKDTLVAEADLSKTRLRDIESSDELYSYLKEVIGDLSRKELKKSIVGNEDLLEILEETGAIEWL